VVGPSAAGAAARCRAAAAFLHLPQVERGYCLSLSLCRCRVSAVACATTVQQHGTAWATGTARAAATGWAGRQQGALTCSSDWTSASSAAALAVSSLATELAGFRAAVLPVWQLDTTKAATHSAKHDAASLGRLTRCRELSVASTASSGTSSHPACDDSQSSTICMD
jgi:hypothetical protein